MWTYQIHDTITGDRRHGVQVADASWSTMLSDIGGGQHKVMTTGSGLTGVQWRDLLYPWANTFVQCWNGVPVYAGLILGWTLDRKTRVLTVRHKELRLILNRRFAYRVGARAGQPHFTVRDKSLRGVITELVRVGLSRSDGGDGWNVPIGMPAGSEAGNSGTTLFNYDFVTIENAIAEVEDRDGGPDVHFNPRFTAAGRLEWELQIGIPRLFGETYDFAMNVPGPALVGVEPTVDGTEMLTGVFTIGKGSEKAMRVGEAGLVQLPARPKPIPFLDSSRSFKEIDSIADLNAHGVAELRSHGAPTEQWEVQAVAGTRFNPALVRPGCTIRMRYERDFWEGTRDVDQYVIAVSGSHEKTVTLDVQPLGGL